MNDLRSRFREENTEKKRKILKPAKAKQRKCRPNSRERRRGMGLCASRRAGADALDETEIRARAIGEVTRQFEGEQQRLLDEVARLQSAAASGANGSSDAAAMPLRRDAAVQVCLPWVGHSDGLAPLPLSATTKATTPPAVDADTLAAQLLDQLLHAGVERAVAAPVQPHAARLSSGRRGLSVVAIRAIRVFYAAHSGLEKFMGDVCKEAGFDASVCALTRSTGLSLAESLVLVAQTSEADPAGLIGEATCFFSYSWTGTRLGDMLTAIERKLVALEADDGRARYVWVDMFAASQNLLSGAYLPAGADARQALKLADPAAYAARKEDTDHIFDDALDGVRDLLLYASPLLGEWTAPPQPYLLADRGEPPAEWRRRGPGAMTRAWCMFELVSSLARARGCTWCSARRTSRASRSCSRRSLTRLPR